MVNIADIPDGTIVRGRLIRYDDQNGEIDVPDYDGEGVGSVVEGPLTSGPRSWDTRPVSSASGRWRKTRSRSWKRMDDIERIVAALTAAPTSLREATSKDGLPAKPGLYSWWTVRGSIPAVPGCPHPSEHELDLFYVGISPSRATSSRTLRARILQNHIGGNTGSSTFRLTLASLLFEEKGWKPLMQTSPVLLPDDNRSLTEWQHENLRLNWAVQPEPWMIEHDVIARLQPPLNLAGNKSHPFAATVSAARRRFKEAAMENPAGA